MHMLITGKKVVGFGGSGEPYSVAVWPSVASKRDKVNLLLPTRPISISPPHFIQNKPYLFMKGFYILMQRVWLPVIAGLLVAIHVSDSRLLGAARKPVFFCGDGKTGTATCYGSIFT
jgi:hypothetical protein